MTTANSNEVKIRVFRGNDEDQYEAYIQFFDSDGCVLITKNLCHQNSSADENCAEDAQVLDLDDFFFYEWKNVGRIECHSDTKDICLGPKIRPKVGTVEFIDERLKNTINRGRFTFVDADEVAANYDISQFFDMMEWNKPQIETRKVPFKLFNPLKFPVEIESFFNGKTYTSTTRFFDALGNQIDIEPYAEYLHHEDPKLEEEWTIIDLPRFLKECWPKVTTIECRSDLSALDRFRYVKGNIDYLIYCKANNYKKLPEYLYKRIQTKKLEVFLQDIKLGI